MKYKRNRKQRKAIWRFLKEMKPISPVQNQIARLLAEITVISIELQPDKNTWKKDLFADIKELKKTALKYFNRDQHDRNVAKNMHFGTEPPDDKTMLWRNTENGELHQYENGEWINL